MNNNKMRKFNVRLTFAMPLSTIVVDASDEDDAYEVARKVAAAISGRPRDLYLLTAEARAITEAEPDARTATYVCAHCGKSSPKAAWGPGRIRCPDCGQIAPAAGDHVG